ncbi:two-component system, OmpR family, alkaline phosphatase synthesis response regulator PhoP [Candidatus Kryptonium thompsonii]|jgi:two-component system phosphate regulon response regulator PhoB/two-component system alkaline phosphatase synthesis response regulator PhoP|uniref:Phosphate regulon transcriptional regulatory protein PhoB n=4 Tax=Candidatus Kryptonium thompsonii TaxID=1633631 RepID=A0A0P1P5D1_9BACT|nr:response regulator transcription factor [Candidatus Kryptonium thompsoni]CUS77046.1 two-component system, OmpR family, alkaline phosphatase synthesis response regulator PhoP [Candidatus Kryptonium thompsoni]CUS78120.1 two-component system, OmpR family, alkaline phosphatase synthesis response regulator PhoP [Candidatus Kryptonium thompsoni]CUS83764.1 two-component system, OmpR family, alkaline phosphatase synthesis response regulator PhoP [Candidatus Kryptonium thompsoni]CUS85276.1 two-compon
MNGKTIAIIEDDKDILELIALHVQKAGFKPKKFTDGESFFRYLSTDMPDVLILDLMLPDMDGLEICKVLRSNPSTAKLPIIILTAKIEETDKIVGLELGADDYITKPFSPRELIARVKAVLRRTSEEETTEEEILKVGDKIVIDVNKMEVYVEGKKVDLTLTEFKILKHLAKKPGWVFSREQLLDAIWGVKKSVIDRTVDVHIKKLRDKLGKAGKLIKSVRGMGYKIEIE